jgi:hypothetical protein
MRYFWAASEREIYFFKDSPNIIGRDILPYEIVQDCAAEMSRQLSRLQVISSGKPVDHGHRRALRPNTWRSSNTEK